MSDHFARQRANQMIIAKITGVASQPGTPASDSDP